MMGSVESFWWERVAKVTEVSLAGKVVLFSVCFVGASVVKSDI